MAGQKITLDIATRFLGQNEDMFIVRPGENFSLYNDIVRKNAIFLDFPDIRLAFDGSRPKKDALRQAVVRSMELREWHRRGRVGSEPSREPRDYVEKTRGRRVGRYVGAVDRLYYGLPASTIIVVPGPGYFSDVLIGEIVGQPVEIGNVSLYPGETLPARRVRWIGRRAKARFSEKLRDRLQKPTPLMVIDRSLRHEILEAAYDQFVIGTTFSARLKTTERDFSTLDDYNIQTFVNYVSGVLVASEENSEVSDVKLAQALSFLSAHRDLVPELTSNINSPGALRLFSEKIFPITVAVLLAVALAAPTSAPTQLPEIEVINSAVAGDDPCALVVQQQAMDAVQMMDLDTWHQVCVQARDAAKSTGLSTSITVVPDPDQP